jgi:DNA replication initiation complex subunit (GINS family)
MDENINYDYLWQAYQKEKQTNQLLLIPKTFYDEALKFVKVNESTPYTTQHTPENTIRLINDFFEKRKQKILIYIAYNKPLPQPISNNETEFYNRILQIVKSEKLDLSGDIKVNLNTLKSIKDIPEIILPSGNKIGPLRKDQIVEAGNEQDRKYLIENTICEQI